MSLLIFSNNATTTLGAPLSSGSTTALLAPGSGALFPNPSAGQYFVLSFFDALTHLVTEIVWVTARSVDTLTIVRGQEGTTPASWLTGDVAANYWTAGQAAAMIQVAQLQQQATNFAVDSGSANALVATLTPAPPSLAFLAGAPLRIQAAAANTGAATLNVNGLGAVAIVNADGSALTAGQITAGQISEVTYNGTSFNLVGGGASAQAVLATTGSLTLSNGWMMKWVRGAADPADNSEPTQTLAWDAPFSNAVLFGGVSTEIASATILCDMWYQFYSLSTAGISVQRQHSGGSVSNTVTTTPYAWAIGY